VKTKNNVCIDFTVSCKLSESEARALDALVGYGFKEFLEVFYEKMGKAYLEPHASGLKTLFETVQADVVPALSKIDDARDALKTL
jgi:hypothetical protein